MEEWGWRLGEGTGAGRCLPPATMGVPAYTFPARPILGQASSCIPPNLPERLLPASNTSSSLHLLQA